MYKDKTKAREAGKERIRRYRERQGVTSSTSEGVTSTKGVTIHEIGWKPPDDVLAITIPGAARVLPQSTINSVLAVLWNRDRLGLFDDSKDRWERAVTWYDWDKRGRPVEG